MEARSFSQVNDGLKDLTSSRRPQECDSFRRPFLHFLAPPSHTPPCILARPPPIDAHESTQIANPTSTIAYASAYTETPPFWANFPAGSSVGSSGKCALSVRGRCEDVAPAGSFTVSSALLPSQASSCRGQTPGLDRNREEKPVSSHDLRVVRGSNVNAESDGANSAIRLCCERVKPNRQQPHFSPALVIEILRV